MKEKNYKITYKNGIERVYKAYSMEFYNHKIYQCCKTLTSDQGAPSVFDGSNILKVEEINK